jgi:CheY-like chemotaxis protein
MSTAFNAEGLRVLVVDDNPDAADSMAMLLRLWGHHAQVSYDGTSALEMACFYQPDVILLDIGMPLMDGFEVAEQLRQQDAKEPILIAVTGFGDAAHRLRGDAAFDHYLIKPIEGDELERLLATINLPKETGHGTSSVQRLQPA